MALSFFSSTLPTITIITIRLFHVFCDHKLTMTFFNWIMPMLKHYQYFWSTFFIFVLPSKMLLCYLESRTWHECMLINIFIREKEKVRDNYKHYQYEKRSWWTRWPTRHDIVLTAVMSSPTSRSRHGLEDRDSQMCLYFDLFSTLYIFYSSK